VSVRACDLLVIGAGPAGSAAATVAARSGLDVVLADKARFPRDKCCGDGLTAGALRLLDDLGLDPATLPSWRTVREVHMVGPSGRSAELPLPTGPGQHAVVVRRRELDAALVALAAGAGAEVREGEALRSIDPAAEDRVRAVVGDQPVEARYVVAADGMWSPVRRALGVTPPGYLGEWHAFRQYFSGPSEQASRQLVVWFEADLLPGYAWSFPLGDGSVNVGFGIQRDGVRRVQDMKRAWAELLDRPALRRVLGPDLEPEGTHRAWPIPARLGRLDPAAGRVLFVGDAAGATDPMTGEGIGQALETGIVAVRSLAAAGPDRPDEAARRYRHELERHLVRDHALARRLSVVLRRPRGVEAAMRLADLSGWTRRNFARWLFEDYPRAVVLTPSRWRSGLFTGPGAFTGSGPADRAA
jgi:menaquinone-9 beta-reductase